MTTAIDPARTRRLGLSTAAIIVAYAVAVGAISAAASSLGPGVVSPPAAFPRPVVLALLLSIPAGIAAIGSMRASRPLLIAAGLLCLVQSFLAFSGVTIPFVIPALLLLVIGGNGAARSSSLRASLGGALIVALGVAALIAPFVLTQTTCWVARRGANGSVIYTQTPATNTDSGTLGLDDLASGCGSGELTIGGVGLAAFLGIGAIAVAAVASGGRPLAIEAA
jgi:hypothetical protein